MRPRWAMALLVTQASFQPLVLVSQSLSKHDNDDHVKVILLRWLCRRVAGAAADDDSEEEEGGRPWTSNAIANCTQGRRRRCRWCLGSCVCRRAGPRLTDMTVVVKMLGIVSNVVPKLVQRNFRNSLMLPLNECTRTWVAHIHTHTATGWKQDMILYSAGSRLCCCCCCCFYPWMAVAVLEWCAAVLVVCINSEIKCTCEFCHL